MSLINFFSPLVLNLLNLFHADWKKDLFLSFLLSLKLITFDQLLNYINRCHKFQISLSFSSQEKKIFVYFNFFVFKCFEFVIDIYDQIVICSRQFFLKGESWNLLVVRQKYDMRVSNLLKPSIIIIGKISEPGIACKEWSSTCQNKALSII